MDEKRECHATPITFVGRVDRVMRTEKHFALEYIFIAGLFLITVDVHLVQMSPLPTKERRAWRPQIPGQTGELIGTCMDDAAGPTFTDSEPARIFPHETASSGRAPESEPSNSWPVF
jgi:hypothetical protein